MTNRRALLAGLIAAPCTAGAASLLSIGIIKDDPFYGVLIVCENREQIRRIKEAFACDAYYSTYFSALTGMRFDRIIAVRPWTRSETELSAIFKIIEEVLPTRLTINGKLIVL